MGAFPIVRDSAPSAVTHEGHLKSCRERVIVEVRRLAYLARHSRQVLDEDLGLHVVTEPRRGEVAHGEDERGHVLEFGVFHEADVLEVVRLLDVSDRVLDAPPAQVSFDDLPERLVGALLGERRQQDHRMGSESLHDDEMEWDVRDVR